MNSFVATVGVCILALAAQALADCNGKGQLVDRLDAYTKAKDLDNNGRVSKDEFVKDLTDHYDKDGDGCVTREEWDDRWINVYKFSQAYSDAAYSHYTNLYTHGQPSDCRMKISQVLKHTKQELIFKLDGKQLAILKTYCISNEGNDSCDCEQFKALCQLPRFRNYFSCKNLDIF